MKKGIIYIGNQIKCDPDYHNEQNLQWYKSIIDKFLSKIDWIIDFAAGKYEWDNNVDVQNYVSDEFTEVLRMVKQLLKIENEPLDLKRHLAQYHYLPTHEIHPESSNVFDLIKAIEIVTKRLKYDEFMKNLADSINNQSSELREIPQEIKLNDNLWFISLNWCNSDSCNANVSNLLKLHGSCQNYHSMILPTEELHDNVFMTDNYIDQSACNLVQKCNILYLWGTSLSDYDVEIHHLISAGRNIKQIVVINPDEEIFKKAKLLTRIYGLDNVEVIHSFNLDGVANII
ncbi:MAG: SIR2 family protein [Burkholderiales bacterium]|nr:SIR2 family protein [Burkholderiales bacterium]